MYPQLDFPLSVHHKLPTGLLLPFNIPREGSRWKMTVVPTSLVKISYTHLTAMHWRWSRLNEWEMGWWAQRGWRGRIVPSGNKGQGDLGKLGRRGWCLKLLSPQQMLAGGWMQDMPSCRLFLWSVAELEGNPVFLTPVLSFTPGYLPSKTFTSR